MSASGDRVQSYLADGALLDAAEVAELLHMRLSTVLDLARRGVLPGHKIGRRWVFMRDELEASVRAAPSQPAPLVARSVPLILKQVERPVEQVRSPRRRVRALPVQQQQLFGPDVG
jgi:excisionase family DNA binding protein